MPENRRESKFMRGIGVKRVVGVGGEGEGGAVEEEKEHPPHFHGGHLSQPSL